ncbi:methionyl-tRNA formyltransferase [Geomonas anaerohicana]|uniref:Methionyl-tRNA formyltransferase n=1 Tax=Geomonas anaerohicana TaxID=2798583 RepID=A0ABS0YBK5_9BACT|nr:methionyl-tRNA formyltransferase [Geomonas anaerohicana]MBJ6749679.1 methionyl-tRNA formyltransferase [Geomonas anaerohicana]
MRVVFVGASRFGFKCLDRILHLENIEVVGVVTNEERFTISYAPEGVVNVLYADLKTFAAANDIPVHVMQTKMTETGLVAQVKAWQPELFVVVGWYHMVPRILRDMAPAVGLHASLLPDYSGGAPLVWAIINGETEAGITLFEFADGVDNGPVLGQASTEITPEDTIATVYGRIEVLGLDLLVRCLPRVAGGTAQRLVQDESKRRVFPQRRPEDGLVDWNQPAQSIYNFVRAQTHPYPGAFTFHHGKKLHIWHARVADAGVLQGSTPGICSLLDGQVLVACGNNTAIEILQVSADGAEVTATTWFSQHDKHAPVVFDAPR